MVVERVFDEVALKLHTAWINRHLKQLSRWKGTLEMRRWDLSPVKEALKTR
ncbi:MAG: hypothetical protein QW343_03905 [Candidatus Norongarragalinales archaeon]